ncbi:MAG: serine hydrolase domain-containing protein [Anaerolineae bacterium]|jgi:CubicO group peptidase (beta-lactamase class C family)
MNNQPTNDQVDRLFARYTRPGSPGCALAVLQDGEIVYKQGYGLASVELGVPNLPSTVFNVGSMAKQFTGFAIALLATEGKLSLDDDLRAHLPDMPDLGHAIILRHLIHHTSGLRGSFPELLALAEWRDTDATTTDDVVGLLKAQRALNHRPGDEYLYVNSNYVLLARVCERASGQSFAEFCRARIFEPLGMARSVVNDSYFKLIPGRACGYYKDEDAWYNAPLTDSVVGPTNVYTTVEDLARWDENFYSGRVGGQAVVEMVHRPGRLNDGTVLDYAFGLQVGPNHTHRGWQMVEHGGSQGGYSAWMVRFPERHLSAVVLFNHFMWDMREYALQVADLFLEDHPSWVTAAAERADPTETAAAVELGAEHLADKAGTYFNAQRAALREITLVQGRLQFQGLDLLPLTETCFCFEVEPETHVEFSLAGDGKVAGMKTITSSGEYGYDRVETLAPTAEQLARYAGRYYSPELDLSWTIDAGDDHLVARRRKYVDSKLTPVFVDAFSDDWTPLMGYPTTYLVVFDRDEAGAITGLRVSGTRVRNLQFIKEGERG